MFGERYFGGWYFGAGYFGKAGLSVPGRYFGAGYFGPTYFGSRYFGTEGDLAPHEVTVTTGLVAAGAGLFGTAVLSMENAFTLSVAQGLQASGSTGLTVGAFVPDFNALFELNAPLELTSQGSASLAATLGFTFGGAPGVGRYFGGGYFGSEYFGASYFGTDLEFSVSLTSALSAAGVGTLAATPAQSLSLATSALSAAGTAAISASPNLVVFPVVITRGLLAAGTVSFAATLLNTLAGRQNRGLSTGQGARSLTVAQGSRSVKTRRS